MPAGVESLLHRSPSRRRSCFRRSILSILFAFALGALAGCGLSPDWRPPGEASATASPVAIPTYTEFVLSSEGLFTDAIRHIGVTSRYLASLPAGAVLPPAPSGDSERGVSVLLADRTTLHGELYQGGDQSQPAILILGGEISAWGTLPLQLSQVGFVVLVIQTDPLTPARQVETLLQSLIAIPGVDASAIGVIGEARSADLAMLGCAVNTLCDALALFSPTSRQTLLNMIPSFGERPLWLTASRSDSESHAAALSLSQALRGRAQLVEVDSGRGAGLLNAEPGLADRLVTWFALQLKDG